MKLVQWPLICGLSHLVQRRRDWRGHRPPRPLLAVPNVTVHPPTASVSIAVLLYNGPLICGFNAAPVKELKNFNRKCFDKTPKSVFRCETFKDDFSDKNVDTVEDEK